VLILEDHNEERIATTDRIVHLGHWNHHLSENKRSKFETRQVTHHLREVQNRHDFGGYVDFQLRKKVGGYRLSVTRTLSEPGPEISQAVDQRESESNFQHPEEWEVQITAFKEWETYSISKLNNMYSPSFDYYAQDHTADQCKHLSRKLLSFPVLLLKDWSRDLTDPEEEKDHGRPPGTSRADMMHIAGLNCICFFNIIFVPTIRPEKVHGLDDSELLHFLLTEGIISRESESTFTQYLKDSGDCRQYLDL